MSNRFVLGARLVVFTAVLSSCSANGESTEGDASTCSHCPEDCGACGPVCGNRACDSGETCGTCPDDCGACGPVCGNGACESGETCGACPDDCGGCTAACGDGNCSAGEACSSCASDCGTCLSTPKESYVDVESGREVWRMTDAAAPDMMLYYDWPTISPNGRYLIFRTNRVPYIYIVNTDGSGEQPIGDWSTWNSQRGVDFSTSIMHGWWSHDSSEYYVFKDLYVIDVDQFQNGAAPSEYISQIAATHADSFYYPMLSPDGRSLFGVSMRNDSATGLLKLINVDGSDYREFTMPFYAAGNGSQALDVTHGWLGNNHAWYMNDDPVEYLNAELVFDVQTGAKASDFPMLNILDPTGADEWYGIMDHFTTSPSAYHVGDGAGWVGGHGRAVKIANSDFTTQDPALRELTYVGPVIANHFVFSPDAKWIATGDTMTEDKGMHFALPVNQSATEPVKIARFTAAANVESMQNSSDPRFSPDGTKNVFYGDVREPGNYDLYMAIFKKPDAPSAVAAGRSASGTTLTWRPAAMHREIRAYEIEAGATQHGSFRSIATVSAVVTYLDVPSKVNATDRTITVDDTSAFPSSGVIEISGMSTEVPSELVQYSGKTATSFTGCVRGYGGTAAAEHWHDAFVWADTATVGYSDAASSGQWYRVRSIEWSGLQSDYSSAAQASAAPGN